MRHRRARVILGLVVALTVVAGGLPAVALANVPPSAQGQSISVAYGTAANLTLKATDPDGPAGLTYAIASPPAHGGLGGLNPATGAVTYTPAAGYSGPDSFTFTASDGAATSAPATVQITVSPQPTVSLAPANLGFGEQPVGTTGASQAVTLTNTSGVPVTISAITVSGDFVRTATCLATLDPGASCVINVSFAPTAPGLRTGQLSISTNASGSPHLVGLGGVGAGGSSVAVLTLATSGAGTVARAPGGTPTGPPGATTYPLGATVGLTAQAEPGHRFIAWFYDGAYAGWANPLSLTMDANHSVTAVFAPLPTFSDAPGGQPYSVPLAELAARLTIRGYGDGRVGPDDGTLRAQMAALIARAVGWDGEDWGNPFPDRGPVDADLWRNVGTVAHYGVAVGFRDGTFGPTQPVLHAQTVSLIARAMVAKGFWTPQPDNPAYYTNVPASSGHREDIATFVHYAGPLPDYPTGVAFGPWNGPAPRGWFARALWQALDSYFGVDRVP